MRDAETQGLVLYSRNYKEKDKLVKIFTESFGKRMFFVKILENPLMLVPYKLLLMEN